jgi:glutaryl-CoA dehydrogenase
VTDIKDVASTEQWRSLADMLGVDGILPRDRLARLDELREFFQKRIRPLAVEHWNNGTFPFELLPELGELELVDSLSESGDPLFTGLVQLEMTRADTSFSTFFGVHNELFVAGIELFGSRAQKEKYLPDLLALRTIGAFALTEPDHGSDISRNMATTATRHGNEWVLDGQKRWIGNATFSDFVLVWARDTADDQIKGFIVEKDRPGFSTRLIENKIAVRSVQNADIALEGVRIPYENWLPGTTSFSVTNQLLMNSRVWVAWQAVGQQFAAVDVARSYALERQQFGKPLATRQLVQSQLVEMIENASLSLSLMVQIARVQESGTLTMDRAALAKASCTRLMRETVAIGRALLGGNGITTDYEMAKIFADAEAIYSYEGTYEVNSLIVGRAVTGMSAF